ncbi:hypothetical protein [Tenacibaculum mesophilum]
MKQLQNFVLVSVASDTTSMAKRRHSKRTVKQQKLRGKRDFLET